jgi:hypothetical protein
LHLHRYVRNTLLMLGVTLLVLPAALSDGHERQHRPAGEGQQNSQAAYVFKGTFNVADSSVSVTKGNRHVRRAGLVGQTIALDLSGARVHVADVNGDGVQDAADLHEGDIVTVKAYAPRRGSHAATFSARWVIAQPHKRRHGQ